MIVRKPGTARALQFGAILLAAVLFMTFAVRTLAAIDLLYFYAQTEATQIRLVWETATELDNAGYFVLRSQSGGSDPGTYTPIQVLDANTGIAYNFIPARGNDLTGALYEFNDPNVTIGTRYFYFLQDVDTNNNSSFHGPVEAVAGQTSTPSPSATLQPTATRTRTPTPSGSRTPTRTSIPAPFRTATPTRTRTPFPQTATQTETPTSTITPDPSLSAVELTETAISVVLTGLPTSTATVTPIVLANRPTATPTESPTVDPTAAAALQDAPPLPPGRIALIGLVVLISGGLFTAGILFFIRRDSGEDGEGGT